MKNKKQHSGFDFSVFHEDKLDILMTATVAFVIIFIFVMSLVFIRMSIEEKEQVEVTNTESTVNEDSETVENLIY